MTERPTYLRLVDDSGGGSTRIPQYDDLGDTLVLSAEEIELVARAAPEREIRRRGRLYDALLSTLRRYARDHDPEITIDDASEMLVDFPVFLSELRLNLRGQGLVREMPNVPGY
jgi:hypothetical protein